MRERASDQSEQCGESKRVSGASGRASGPVLTSRFQGVLNHCGAWCVRYTAIGKEQWCENDPGNAVDTKQTKVEEYIDCFRHCELRGNGA